MNKCRITVYDYPRDDTAPPEKIDVEAWCVGGEAGVRAYFFWNGLFCTAVGDDGHWRLVTRMAPRWVDECTQAMLALQVEYETRLKRKSKRKFD